MYILFKCTIIRHLVTWILAASDYFFLVFLAMILDFSGFPGPNFSFFLVENWGFFRVSPEFGSHRCKVLFRVAGFFLKLSLLYPRIWHVLHWNTYEPAAGLKFWRLKTSYSKIWHDFICNYATTKNSWTFFMVFLCFTILYFPGFPGPLRTLFSNPVS